MPATALRLRAVERREVFSIYPELRALSWAGVMLVVAGVGVLLAQNLDRIGPSALAAALAVAAAACYGWAWWRRTTGTGSLVDDYVLLLGALLLGANIGYVEVQFQLLDQGWPRHLLLLAAVHGAGAYVFGSRVLLALSISSLAAWLGIEQRLERTVDVLFDHDRIGTAARAYLTAVIVGGWRLVHQRLGGPREFGPVFDHFMAHLALLGSLVLTFQASSRAAGTIATLLVAAAITAYGVRRASEALVLSAYVYAVIAVDVFAVAHLRTVRASLVYLVASTIVAIVGLFLVHGFYGRRTR